MKPTLLFRNVLKNTFYVLLLLCASFSVSAQCPTIPVTNPSPICDASGLTFNDLMNAPYNFVTDEGDGVVWYDALTGGNSFNLTELVQERTYYVDDIFGSCSGSRESITIDFTVDPTGRVLDRIYCSNVSPTIQDYIDEVLTTSIPLGGSVEVYYPSAPPNPHTLANPTDVLPPFATNVLIAFVDNLSCKSQFEYGQIFVISAPQDPTPTSPQEFCASANPTIADLDTGTLATNINWYQNLDGFGNPILPSLPQSTPLVDGNTYYVQIDDIFCDSNPIPVIVNIDAQVDAGTSAIMPPYCEDDIPTTAPFNLFDELGGFPQTTGNWTSSTSLAITNDHLGTVDISTLIAGTHVFTYTIPSNGVCPPGISTVSIIIYETLTSGTPSTITNPTTFCEAGLPAAFDLTTLLNGDEDPNGQWRLGTLSTDPIVTSPIDLTTGTFTPATYNFTYTQNVLTPCPEESTTVQVVVLADPNAGTAINDTFCENDLATNSPYSLFDALDGSQDNNLGTWTDATNAIITNPIDITGLTLAGSPYTFNYTIDNGTCSDTEAITLTVLPAPESGTPIATFPEFCEGTVQTVNLFDLLTGEDPTGTWNDDDTSGALSGNEVTIGGLVFGTYDFTFDVDAIGGCDDTNVTVSIIINPLPNTGTPIPAIYCENDLGPTPTSLNLFDQLTGETGGGVWTDDNTTGALTGSNLDLTALAIGSYNFTYIITDVNTCTNSSIVTVTINDAPESGTPVMPFSEFCVVDITAAQTVNLFDLLTDEDPTGTWSDDDASGALSINTVTIDGLAPGTYNFTYDVTNIGTCDDVDVTVSITINDTPVPTTNATQEFCDVATVGDLVATGTTIQWYDDATGGTALVGTVALIDGENYFATDTDAVTGCESSTRTEVTVTIHQSPNAGIAVNPGILECNDTTIDLFDGLDGTQDGGGIWYEGPDNTGAVVVTPTTYDVTGFSANSYEFTYYVTASSPCVDDSTTITVTIEEPLSAGTSNGDPTFCSTDGIFDLDSNLTGASPGGEWTFNSAVITNQFDPAIGQSGTYTYTTSNACGNSSTSFDISVTPAPNAGTSAPVLICVIDGPTDLFAFLGSADTGGTWSPALTSGTGVFDPLADTDGVYTYTVTANSPCATNATADITVTVSDIIPPVVNNATMTFCLVDNPTVADLDAALTVTGAITWYEDATLTTQLNTTDTLVDGEDYYATQRNASGCESSISVQVDVIVNDTPTPTILNPSVEYCINDGPTINDLTLNIAEYNASTDNIIWYDEETNGATISSSSILNHDTTYYAVLVDAITGCESSVRLELTTDLTSCGKLVLPDGFSPNGDGTNDTYDFDNLHILYPDFVIEIFNRHGNIVYKGNANTPRFDGISNQSRTLGSGDLPVGVYFYIFNFNDGENKPEQGRLYLSR
ncbi:gliding motility-associated C-terminal domain-containing protein [Flavivirga jejuensis]|uniref:Gliding motility-associated C-terminal domain-containing protein n=1 Tax=Flavivirga jejuensis TaxID=870487 RepID=A0ABT8WNB9_9FLAO|nr:gliding motility-associated C-terminal domain-containing protein [Flavivirga jejuensis]MDO5974659.1 gliding motility-associated C-terminal domain-containing protein [Flavivirga jejuensis]